MATPNVYFGKPENKRDPSAVTQPPPKKNNQPAQQQQTNKRPTPASSHPTGEEVLRTGCPFSDSIFGKSMTARENNSRVQFTPTNVGTIEISRQIYEQLITDDNNLIKIILPEYIDYYHTFCYWARVVTLKQKNQESLTQQELGLLQIISQREYTLLEPMAIYLKGLGNITTSTGQHLHPTFPPLPIATVGNKHGFFGAIAANNHNLYEEIPCLGVLAEAIQYAVSNENPGTRASVLSTQHATVNRNLLGFYPLLLRRQEAKLTAISQGITDDAFEESIANTAINTGFINKISNILATTRTFKTHTLNFATLASTGSLAQIVTTQKSEPDVAGRDVISEVIPHSMALERPSIYGASVFAAYQLTKSNVDANWLCITPGAGFNVEPYRENKNIRRNLPDLYKTNVFCTVSQTANDYRDDIIKTLTLTKR